MVEMYQEADWKIEKHAPVIEIDDTIPKDKLVTVHVSVGKDIPHPNTTEHHIRWIRLFFMPKGKKMAYEIGIAEFNAHGEGTKGPNTGGVYTEPQAIFAFKTSTPGTLIATAFCNIHGLWKSEKEINVSE